MSEPTGEPGTGPATAAFVAHRNLLFTVAYEMLSSAVDAEDVVQEAWLRWADLGQDGQAGVRDPGPTWCGSLPGRRSTGCAQWLVGGRSMSVSGCRSRF